jgi:hypothetical protein
VAELDSGLDGISDRRSLSAEVIELGEALFDSLVEVVTDRSETAHAQIAPPIDELRAASDEFFVALRLLLGLEDGAP